MWSLQHHIIQICHHTTKKKHFEELLKSIQQKSKQELMEVPKSEYEKRFQIGLNVDVGISKRKELL